MRMTHHPPRCPCRQVAGLLSYRYLTEEGLEDVVVPLVGWDATGRALGLGTAAERQKRQASLTALYKWTPYKNEAGLQAAVRQRCGARGTAILIYHLWMTAAGNGSTELDFRDKYDIRTRQVRPSRTLAPCSTFQHTPAAAMMRRDSFPLAC